MTTGEGEGRLWWAPLDDGAWQWGREFGYDPSTNKWYVENGFDVNGNLDVSSNINIGRNICMGSECISTLPKLQCPPKRVIVDEESANWDERAEYVSCSASYEYVDLYYPTICDFDSCHLIYWSSNIGCDPFCKEFGFSRGELPPVPPDRTDTRRVFYEYYDKNEGYKRWHLEGCGTCNPASVALYCRCYP